MYNRQVLGSGFSHFSGVVVAQTILYAKNNNNDGKTRAESETLLHFRALHVCLSMCYFDKNVCAYKNAVCAVNKRDTCSKPPSQRVQMYVCAFGVIRRRSIVVFERHQTRECTESIRTHIKRTPFSTEKRPSVLCVGIYSTLLCLAYVRYIVWHSHSACSVSRGTIPDHVTFSTLCMLAARFVSSSRGNI